MFVDPERKVMFCLPVKSGGTLLRKVLSELGGWNLQPLSRVTADVADHVKVAVVRETLSRLLVTFGYKFSASQQLPAYLSDVLSAGDFQPAVDRHFQP